MLNDIPNIKKTIDSLYRQEYGKLVSVLTKTFGIENITIAEDVVQDAILEALKQWEVSGVPENSVGWIYQVAKNKTLNILKRHKYKIKYQWKTAALIQSEWTSEPTIEHIFTEKEIADDQLRMMFTCCHPSLSTDSQIAFTLKTLCGCSISEIAKAFLTTEENIHKRLVRARKSLRESNTLFEIPTGPDLEPRLNAVLDTIYLLFNEGYNSTSGSELIKYELCQEAIRLTNIIVTNPNIKGKSIPCALLSLMLLNTSRFKSRVDEYGRILDLQHQDRRLWDQSMITKGLRYLEDSVQNNIISHFHILATISAHHCTAGSYASTDWHGILDLYDQLIELKPSPLAKFNRAIVLAKIEGADTGLDAIENIEDKKSFKNYLPYYICKAELLYQKKDLEDATTLLKKALKLTDQDHTISLIKQKLNEYSRI